MNKYFKINNKAFTTTSDVILIDQIYFILLYFYWTISGGMGEGGDKGANTSSVGHDTATQPVRSDVFENVPSWP